MKHIIMSDKYNDKISIDDVGEMVPIFAKKGDEFCGMLIAEKEGWILRYPNGSGCCGHHKTRQDCLKSARDHGYEFFT